MAGVPAVVFPGVIFGLFLSNMSPIWRPCLLVMTLDTVHTFSPLVLHKWCVRCYQGVTTGALWQQLRQQCRTVVTGFAPLSTQWRQITLHLHLHLHCRRRRRRHRADREFGDRGAVSIVAQLTLIWRGAAIVRGRS